MKLKTFYFVALMLPTFLSGCSLFDRETDSIEVATLPVVSNQFEPELVWSHSVGQGVGKYYSTLSPVVQDYIVYAADRFGVIEALDLYSGKVLWKTNLAEKSSLFKRASAMISGGVTVYADKLFVASERGVVFALNSRTGELLWQKEVGGEVLAKPVVTKREGNVLVHTSNGLLQALSMTSGDIVWSSPIDVSALSLRGQSTPTVARDVALVGDDNGHLNAYLTENGQLVWQQKISNPRGKTEIDQINDIDVTPIVQSDIVYAMGYNGNLVAIDLRSGQMLWSRDVGSVKDFVLHNGRIFLVDKEDRVESYTISSGNRIWKQSDLLNRRLTSPGEQQGYIVIGDAEGYLHWIDTLGGVFVAQKLIDKSGFLSQPIVANDLLIIQARNGKVYAISRY